MKPGFISFAMNLAKVYISYSVKNNALLKSSSFHMLIGGDYVLKYEISLTMMNFCLDQG